MVAFTQGVTFHANTPIGAAYPSARLAIQIAWGADLTNPGSWVWYDVTSHVEHGGMATITIGAPDESTETPPARCTFAMMNPAGLYTPGNPRSSLYPHVRRGTPVRVVVTMDGTVAGLRTRFQGRAVGFTPQVTNGYGTVKVVAAGFIQQMLQGKVPISPMRVACLRDTDKMRPTAYWPLEDGKNATSGLSAVGGQALESVGRLRAGFGDADFAIGSLPVVRLKEGQSLWAPMSLSGRYQRVQFLVQIPEHPARDGVTDFTLMRVTSTGTVKAFNIDFSAGAAGDAAAVFILRGYGETGSEVLGSPRYVIGRDDIPQWISFELEQSGSSLKWALAYCPWGIATDTGRERLAIYVTSGTVSNAQIGVTTNVWVAPYEQIDGIGIGHICGYGSNTFADVPSGYGSSAIIGHAGDQVDDRIGWLVDERGGFTIDMPDAMDTECGPMPIGTTIDVIRDAVRTEGGMLLDGLTDGLTAYGRERRYNQTAAMTIAATSVGEGGLLPADNDQRTRNRVRGSRPAGGEYTAEDVDGPMGIDAIGLYEGTVTANPSLEDALPQYAQWALHLGTQPGLRWPTVPINLTSQHSLVASWLLLTPCDRVDLTGLSTAMPGVYPDALASIVEGWTEVISDIVWDASLNLTPYDPYAVGEVGGGQVLDCGASYLSSDITASTTSVPVTIWDSCAWSAADGSFDIEIDGDVMTVTAAGSVTGTSPRYQTLTVTRSAESWAHVQGAEVHVANPYTVAL
jgi:hypothetical protein